MNRLAGERSPYLTHAADQKIDWYPWSDEAFEKARRENKSVFLSSGAIWCHWCHVMAKECFFDDEITALLNENFVSIKLDRDERPDIDRRYQRAVTAIGAGGGWPLSVFLTPDKKPFFGGTYFPPEDSLGRPGFKKVLREIIKMYQSNRQEVESFTERLMDFIRLKPAGRGEINRALLDAAQSTILSQFDPLNGGFGTAPKFPMPGAISFLLYRYFFTGNKPCGHAAIKTLEAMAKGGSHDQLKGGFHRYSVDEGWTVPHFEKMADDNAWLLRNYVDAWSIFGNEYFKEVAMGIISFTRDVLSGPEGGFYASQDADVTPDDEGGYFTWTEDDFRRVLNDEEFQVLSLHLLHERGSMHHDRSKRVLFIAAESGDIARKLKIDAGRVDDVIREGKRKLLQARQTREEPFIDATVYTSLNGMMVTSYFKAYRAFKEIAVKDFALKSLKRVLEIRWPGKELLHSDEISALSDDYIYLIEALVAAYEVSGMGEYLQKADQLMEQCIDRFWDKDGGGFFDADTAVLDLALKGVEDIPHPSANAAAIALLIKLFYATDNSLYKRYAEISLETFSANVSELGVHAGHYFCSLDAYFNMMRLTVEALPESRLADAAASLFVPYASIVYSKDRNRIIPCMGGSCYEPLENEEQLKEFIRSIRR
ncbi:MAG: thioredoxin domain-containing protein [Nitrospirae bacterium]|nr:thioredoxin domain-containing protein [Nitrospirota bacterium]